MTNSSTTTDQGLSKTSDYVFGDDERARLRAAEELLDEGSRRIIQRLGLAAGAHCLEVGGGAGSIAAWLSGQVGPSGRVVVTDLQTRLLDEIGLPNLEVRRHDVVSDDLEPDAFDLIHSRLVLEHIPERDRVLRKLARSLRPGGWLVIEDVDYVSGVPISSLGAAEHEHTQAVRLREFAKLGHDPMFGRVLPLKLRQAGLQDVGNEGRVWIMEGKSAGARWFELSLRHLRQRLVGTGQVSDDEIDRVLACFADPDWAAFSPIILAAWGRRPSV